MTRSQSVLLPALLVATGACGDVDAEQERILLVTTHSVEDSGLLAELTGAFHAAHPEFRLLTTAVGSGAALEIGRRGDADVLLTHDPVGEAAFLAAGHGTEHAAVMENAFLLVGPEDDPSGVGQAPDVVSAFRRIARTGSRFLSRGDDSGTHRKEQELWRRAGLEPWSDRPGWYVEAGLGMAETLQTGTQLDAYLLTDEATYRQLASGLRLTPLSGPHPLLRNPYSCILPERQTNPEGARILFAWLLGPGQEVIGRYGVDRFGESLFRPSQPNPSPEEVEEGGAAPGGGSYVERERQGWS
jgi:tungstate transport system substrate-binding protein